jgi:lipoprotein-anchoring transpeptidase ErfK/SrfK
MDTYNLSPGAINNMSQWFAAQKAAGKVVRPEDVEAAYKAHMDALASERLSESKLTEDKRQFDVKEQTATDRFNTLQANRAEDISLKTAEDQKNRDAAGTAGIVKAGTSAATTALLAYYLRGPLA